MISFKQYYLLEDDTSQEVKAKLKHLEHIEELIINEGPKGAQRAIAFINRLISAVSGNADAKLAVNVKVDGAPSLTCGPLPPGEENAGEFFVGTKSALSPTGKRYTKLNASKIAEENSPGLAEKLITALKYLPALGMTEIYQGDFLFTPGDLKEQTIEGKRYITFKPNTIMYAVEANSETGQAVRRAKMGIVFHTVYTGNTIADMHATFNPDLSKLRETPDVWWKSNRVQDYSAEMPLGAEDVEQLKQKLAIAQRELQQIDPSLFVAMEQNPQLASFIKMHLNSKVRQNQLVGHIEDHLDQLAGFIDARHAKDIEKFKTAAKKQQVAAQQQHYNQLVAQLRPQLAKMFSFFNHITEIKTVFLSKIKGFGGLEAFYKEGDKYTRTAGEGLVIADTETHEIAKIVDRLDFARQNFNAPKEW